MAKKKAVIDITKENLSFSENGITYKLLKFYPHNMTIDTYRYGNGIKTDLFNIPFAHIPKKLKKLIKQN